MRIAITTPTGTIGRQLVHILQDAPDIELTLMARRSAGLETAGRNARVLTGDLQDANYVERATSGVDALFWVITPSFMVDNYRAAQRHLAKVAANAVRRNRISHVVLLSSFGAQRDVGTGLVLGLHDAEQIIRETAERLTILRPGYLMDNYFWHTQSIRRVQRVFLPVSGATRVPMAASVDVAQAAADALLDPPTYGQRIVGIHGPQDYSFDEAAAGLSTALGHHVHHIPVAPDACRKQMRLEGASDDVARRYAQMHEAIESGWLKTVLPRTGMTTTPTSIEQFGARTLAPLLRRSLAG